MACERSGWTRLAGGVAAAALTMGLAAPVAAQEPNTGRVSVSAGVDVPSTYYFRGILQDDRGFIAWPFGEMGLTLLEGDGAVKSLSVDVGTWNSLHRGPTGSSGPSGKLWYESDFYTTVTLGLGGGVSLGSTYTAYTSPNDAFGTVKEIAFSVALDDSGRLGAFALAPYALVAIELDGQADGGVNKGRYLELGVAPGVPVVKDRLTLSFPVKLGLSLRDYYEGPFGSDRFGFVEAGALAEVPLVFIPSGFGSWNLQGGVSVLTFGDALKGINGSDKARVIGLVGVGLSY